MEELRSPGKNSTEVLLRPDGTIKFKGRSIHENIIKFYEPVHVWVDDISKIL